ncbi:MAG: DUF3592 domain-containing protein [Christensenellaceae bacterium]|jgi:hypothetical protein|nr:DUF3592 domain-containing protein [Christensenellaceae bacterium]
MKSLAYNIFKLLGVIFLSVGLIMLAAAAGIGLHDSDIKAHSVAVTATITAVAPSRGDSANAAYISYQAGEKTYTTLLGYRSSTFYVGKQMTIYYDPANPNRIITSFNVASFVLMIIGAVFAMVGLGFLLYIIAKRRKKERLLARGFFVQADFVKIERNLFMQVNGMHPYTVVCRWQDAGRDLPYYFTSENLWFDPAHILAERGICALDVYVNPDNWEDYYVAVEPLMAGQNG